MKDDFCWNFAISIEICLMGTSIENKGFSLEKWGFFNKSSCENGIHDI
ncbi:hypothetical protein [Peribacillus sp. FSL E2-0218]